MMHHNSLSVCFFNHDIKVMRSLLTQHNEHCCLPVSPPLNIIPIEAICQTVGNLPGELGLSTYCEDLASCPGEHVHLFPERS